MCPENPLQNGFWFHTEWFVLVPKSYDVFNKKWQSFLKPNVYYKMASPNPIFFHKMEAYTRVNPTHSVEEMARRLVEPHFVGKGCDRRSKHVSCEKVVPDASKSQFYNCSFRRLNLISCEMVVTDTSNSQFFFSF